ncbi:MAG: EamA family transporter [Clostridia bacterium]|nr:EamA family transporter [Clostridia bacterium]
MKERQSILLVLISAAFWGAAGIFVRGLNNFGITEMQIVFCRAVVTVLIFGIILLLTDKTLFKIKPKDLWAFAGIGILSIVMFNFCYYKTMKLSTLSVAAIMLYTAPFFVIILSRILFKEAITVKKALACIIAFIGCCFVVGIFSGSNSIGGKGIVYGLLTGFGYGLYTIFGNILIKKGYKTLTINFYAFVFAALGSLAFSNPLYTMRTVSASKLTLLLVFGMAVVNTVIPYITYTAALKNIEGSKALIIATLEPVVATILGVAVYKEKLGIIGILGIILVLGSVIMLNSKIGEKNEN